MNFFRQSFSMSFKFPYEVQMTLRENEQKMKLKIQKQTEQKYDQQIVDLFLNSVAISDIGLKKLKGNLLMSAALEFFRVKGQDEILDFDKASQYIKSNDLLKLEKVRLWLIEIATDDDKESLKIDLTIQFKQEQTIELIIFLSILLEQRKYSQLTEYKLELEYLDKILKLQLGDPNPEIVYLVYKLLKVLHQRHKQAIYIEIEKFVIHHLRIISSCIQNKYIIVQFINQFIHEDTNTKELLISNKINSLLDTEDEIYDNPFEEIELQYPTIKRRKTYKVYDVPMQKILDQVDELKLKLGLEEEDTEQEQEEEEFDVENDEEVEQKISPEEYEKLKETNAQLEKENNQLKIDNQDILLQLNTLQEEINHLKDERRELMRSIQPSQIVYGDNLQGQLQQQSQNLFELILRKSISTQTIEQQSSVSSNAEQPPLINKFPPPPPPPPIDGRAPPPPPPPPPPPIDGRAPPPPPPPPPIGGRAPPPPPPPFRGAPGAPPPPPMPGMSQQPVQPKQILPSKPVKQLQWTLLEKAKAEQSVWKELNIEKIELNYKEIEELFEEKKRQSIIQNKDEDKEKDKFQKKVTKLQNQRYQEISFALARLKLTTFEIIEALLKLDLTILTDEKLTLLINAIPREDEIGLWESVDRQTLLNSDLFCIDIQKLKNFRERIKATRLLVEFDDKTAFISEQILCFDRTIQYIINDTTLKSVLACILKVGNFMNGQSFRGNALGATLDSIIDLNCKCTTDNKFDFYMYLVKCLENNKIEINLNENLVDLENLSKETNSMDNLEHFLKDYQKEIQYVTIAKKCNEGGIDNAQEKFAVLEDYMVTFIICQEEQIKGLKNKHNYLCQYFGENPKSIKFHQLIAKIYKFKKVMKEAVIRYKEYNRKKHIEQLRQQRLQQKAQKK